eukprot:CAMPEP_0168464614 /NCGR_PEP_ID=MMETSP0228-20121227/55672_1 /TAXON_ID=133427 /ORGANISM="Protoceratium reticulatum, Strain CCCM 535 (=CCMP 1889)" /LENGTH=450 /DNA_ID=CAMNT_0008480127 /DNA_START=36 /DNA_END=1388 /DNA_ORIENTATION=-
MAFPVGSVLLVLLLLPGASASRSSSHDLASDLNLEDAAASLVSKELQSMERAGEMFAKAFAKEHAAAQDSCPYGNEEKSVQGGETSFDCHWKSKGMGKTCPALQAARLKVAHGFQVKNYGAFLDGVSGYPLTSLFDKSAHLRGDETYEELVKLQIKGLMTPEVVELEDKINLKALAKKLEVPSTTMYFSAHNSTWDRADFTGAVGQLCSSGVDGFMIKATHMAWSAGMKIVRGWQQRCHQAEATQELISFIETEVLGKMAGEADAHLRYYLQPGVTVEELFRTGGHSVQPLEAKIQVLWGKVHHMFLIGNDARGCKIQGGAWHVFSDKTGWDLSGIIKPGGANDETGDRVLREAFDTMVALAERFARGVRADLMRVDFFLGVPTAEHSEWVIKLNECESVSGHPYFHERQHLGSIWRDGYILSNRLSLSPEKWEELSKRTQHDRDAQHLD